MLSIFSALYNSRCVLVVTSSNIDLYSYRNIRELHSFCFGGFRTPGNLQKIFKNLGERFSKSGDSSFGWTNLQDKSIVY